MNNEEDIKLDNELQEGTSNLASRWIRLWASIIDAIILMLITIPILYFTGGVEQIRDGCKFHYILPPISLFSFHFFRPKTSV